MLKLHFLLRSSAPLTETGIVSRQTVCMEQRDSVVLHENIPQTSRVCQPPLPEMSNTPAATPNKKNSQIGAMPPVFPLFALRTFPGTRFPRLVCILQQQNPSILRYFSTTSSCIEPPNPCGGVQLSAPGMIGKYPGHIHNKSKHRPFCIAENFYDVEHQSGFLPQGNPFVGQR